MHVDALSTRLQMKPWLSGSIDIQRSSFTYQPRDATLARVLAMALCPCQSVTSRCSIETAERIGLVFGTGASFLRPTLHWIIRKVRYLQREGYFPLELYSKLWT